MIASAIENKIPGRRFRLLGIGVVGEKLLCYNQSMQAAVICLLRTLTVPPCQGALFLGMERC